MKLEVFVSGIPIAVLESQDGFEHALTYYPNIPDDAFVSLLMPVRSKSYIYPELHPQFQMNLPEGFLLSILQQQLGPHIGASPLNLLSFIGRNTIGRVQLAPFGADLTKPPSAFEVRDILKGDNSEEAFVELVRQYASSGVSGVVPKFLSPEIMAQFNKVTVSTPRYIVKGSSSKLPYIALNEHLSMMVSAKSKIETASTEVSDDGQALLVSRFDVDDVTGQSIGMEDLCSLLALRPAQKYETSWEKVANQVKAFVPKDKQSTELEKLAGILLLTYALGNADCHSKNLALLYSSFKDVRLSPVYDMLSISVYDDYSLNPPGLTMAGRKTWTPRASLQRFTQTQFGLRPAQHKQLVERICDGIVDTWPEVLAHVRDKPGFSTLGMRMLNRWNSGMKSLQYDKSIVVPDLSAQLIGLNTPKVITPRPVRIGQSPLLGSRGKKR